MANIALLASRLPWFLGGAVPAAAGAGYQLLEMKPTPLDLKCVNLQG